MDYAVKVVLCNNRVDYSIGLCTGDMRKCSIFNDHKNILCMMSSTRFQANIARHIAHKLQRWAIRLSEFTFIVEHIPGEDKTWANILERWAVPRYSKFPERRLISLRFPLIIKDKTELPILEVIFDSQNENPPPKDTK